MKIRFILLFVLSLILFCFLPSLAQTSPATLEDITVRIDTNSNHPADVGGSGVLIRGSGDSYTILTAYGSSRLCVIIFAYEIVKCLLGKTFRTILLNKLSV